MVVMQAALLIALFAGMAVPVVIVPAMIFRWLEQADKADPDG